MDINRHMDAALRLAERGRFGEAEQALKDLLESSRNNPEVIQALASVREAQGDINGAFQLMASAATAFPRHPHVVAYLGGLHRHAGRTEEALACSERAIMLAPDEVVFVLRHVETLLVAERAQDALIAAGHALTLAPERSDVHLTVGLVLMALGNQDGARKAFEQAIRLDPASASAHANLAELLALLGDFETAATHAESAHLAEPGEHAFALLYARSMVRIGRLADADRVVKRVLAAAPRNTEALGLQAGIRISLGQADSALANLAAAVRQAPNDRDTLLALGDALRQAGRLREAEAVAERVLALAAKDPIAITFHRDVISASGRHHELWRAMPDEAPSARPGFVVIDNSLGGEDLLLFARYLLRLGGADGKVKVVSDHPLAGMLAAVDGVDLSDDPPAGPSLPMAGLPRYLGLTGSDVPGDVPYLQPDPVRLRRWQQALAAFPRPWIGVVWNRYAPGLTLDLLKPLFPAGVTPVSLTMGAVRNQLRDWPEALDAGLHFDDPLEMVAAVAALDAVVVVDGLAAHVAGALGKDGLVTVPAGYPWYWFANEGRSVWYPSISVVAQSKPGSWTAELDAIGRRIGEWSSSFAADVKVGA